MGFLQKLFGAKSRQTAPTLDDPIFGRIEFEDALWTFIPTTDLDRPMICIDAPETGPSLLQRDFFKKIRADLSQWENRARNYIQPQLPKGVSANTLSTYAIMLEPDAETAKQIFTLEMSDAQANEIHRVTFEGENPVAYGMED